jgi:secondary thiamine-phosphate synthase enzyme
MAMHVYTASFEVSLKVGPDIADISGSLAKIVAASGVRTGTLNATAIGSTASLSTIEYEPGAVEDLKAAITRLAPPDMRYAHEEAWHDGNGHSHVQAALLNPGLVLPVRDGRIHTGTWQQAILINHDNRPRRRSVDVTVIGTD